MAAKSAVTAAIEKAEAEIAFQQRLIEALKATQKAKARVKGRSGKPAAAPTE